MDVISRFARTISERLQALEITTPNVRVVTALCRVIHTASLITEEGRFVQGSVTVADPLAPGQPPRLQRADYPAFTPLAVSSPLTPEFFAKLARAVDKWSGSVAVWGLSANSLVAWGIVDQLVGTNTLLNREGQTGFFSPGILTLIIDRPGDLTAYHHNLFLGSLQAQRVILSESEPFESSMLERLTPHFTPTAQAIECAVGRYVDDGPSAVEILAHLRSAWKMTVSRICIGLRRQGTGGALIITSQPMLDILSIGKAFGYDRVATSLVLQVLDLAYMYALDRQTLDVDVMNASTIRELGFAQEDSKDREEEIRGAVKLVTSLASMDGAVLLTPDLKVIGFGVKIGASQEPDAVFDGEEFRARGKRAKKIDLSAFGTRHGSMLRYCRADPNAIGIVISQDGHVRVATTENDSVVLWDRIQLLNHTNFTPGTVVEALRHRKAVGVRKSAVDLGYSRMPKTVGALLNESRRPNRQR